MAVAELKKGMFFKLFGELYVIENAEGDFIEYSNVANDKFHMIPNSEANRNELASIIVEISEYQFYDMFEKMIANGVQVYCNDGEILLEDCRMDESMRFQVNPSYYWKGILKSWISSNWENKNLF